MKQPLSNWKNQATPGFAETATETATLRGPLHQQDVPPGGFGDFGAAEPQVRAAAQGPSVPHGVPRG